MDIKKICTGGIAAGIVLLILMAAFSFLVSLVLPTDMSQYGGMRAMDDPVMNLFYLYPFVIGFAAAFVFDLVRDCLEGSTIVCGLKYGMILICLMTIPSLFVMVTSMTWPLDFYISTGLWEIVTFPLVGLLFVRIWKL